VTGAGTFAPATTKVPAPSVHETLVHETLVHETLVHETLVKLDATGKGSGQIMAAARIRFDKKKGQYDIESFGNQYIKVTNVRPQ
jgi:hypothetical protein